MRKANISLTNTHKVARGKVARRKKRFQPSVGGYYTYSRHPASWQLCV